MTELRKKLWYLQNKEMLLVIKLSSSNDVIEKDSIYDEIDEVLDEIERITRILDSQASFDDEGILNFTKNTAFETMDYINLN